MAGRAEAWPLDLTLTDLRIGHYIAPLRFWRFACRRRGWYGGCCRCVSLWRCCCWCVRASCACGCYRAGGVGAGGAAGEGHQRDVAGALDGYAEPTLVARADSGHAARKNLAALLHELGEDVGALVVDEVHFLDAELADFFLAEILALAAAGAAGAGAGAVRRGRRAARCSRLWTSFFWRFRSSSRRTVKYLMTTSWTRRRRSSSAISSWCAVRIC